MLGLLTPNDVAKVIAVKDRRTVRRWLAEWGVPIVPAGRSYRVRRQDLEDAIASMAQKNGRPGARSAPRGVHLPPNTRLWDS